MSADIVDRFRALNADDRRRVEIVAASLLAIDATVLPMGKGAFLLSEAMRIAVEVNAEQTQEAKP